MQEKLFLDETIKQMMAIKTQRFSQKIQVTAMYIFAKAQIRMQDDQNADQIYN